MDTHDVVDATLIDTDWTPIISDSQTGGCPMRVEDITGGVSGFDNPEEDQELEDVIEVEPPVPLKFD